MRTSSFSHCSALNYSAFCFHFEFRLHCAWRKRGLRQVGKPALRFCQRPSHFQYWGLLILPCFRSHPVFLEPSLFSIDGCYFVSARKRAFSHFVLVLRLETKANPRTRRNSVPAGSGQILLPQYNPRDGPRPLRFHGENTPLQTARPARTLPLVLQPKTQQPKERV